MRKTYAVATLTAALIAFAVSAPAQSPSVPIGVVVMHGKGGSPTKHVASLASALEQKGYLVANLEMPWSGNRQYDASVEAADKEVGAALDAMRAKGAKKVFVAGHSQGGLSPCTTAPSIRWTASSPSRRAATSATQSTAGKSAPRSNARAT